MFGLPNYSNILNKILKNTEKLMALYDQEIAILNTVATSLQSANGEIGTITTEVQAMQAQLVSAGQDPDRPALDAAIAAVQANMQQASSSLNTLTNAAAPGAVPPVTQANAPGTPVNPPVAVAEEKPVPFKS